MTREQALAVARLLAELDGIALGERLVCKQRSRGRRNAELVWSITSEMYGPGPSAGIVIDDRTGVVLSKAYVGYGARPEAAEFFGRAHSGRFSLLERELFVPVARQELFDFFVDAANVAAISEATLELMTPLPCRLEPSLLVDWRIRSAKHDRPWQLRVTERVVGERLDESQVEGPFSHFRHLLVFRAAGPGTFLRERLEYRLPGGTWGGLIGEALFGATRRLEEALELRYAAVSRHFGLPWPARLQR